MEFKGTIKDLKVDEFSELSNGWIGLTASSGETITVYPTELITSKNRILHTQQIKANAQLISKAPEMLEMLKNVLDNISEDYSNMKQDIEQLIEEATKID